MSPPVVVKLLSQENMQKMFNVQLHFKLTLHLTLNVVPPDSVEVNDDDSQDVKKESEESQVSNV